MIYESQVVYAVSRHLEADGWTIRQELKPTQRGDDIIAAKRGRELRIEAKGEGSERTGSSRHGKPFTRAQVRSHVAVAFYRAAKMRKKNVRAGMAFPDNDHHREMLAEIRNAVRDLRLCVLWVAADGSVSSR